jgi:flavodoxin I
LAAEPVDVDGIDSGSSSLASTLGQHDALIVGTPTWNTGADTQRSGTGWDDLYNNQLPALAHVLKHKKVAVFGLGDQVSYSENYADATGELYAAFRSLGCDMVPYAAVPTDGYEHEASKSVLPGSDGTLFCGLLLDQINQEDYTDARIGAWVSELLANGFAEPPGTTTGSGSNNSNANYGRTTTTTTTTVSKPTSNTLDTTTAIIMEQDSSAVLLDESIAFSSIGGGGTFTPHTNPRTGRTLWTSPDGRQSYVTYSGGETKVPPSTMTTSLRP